jgi:hypothetical protein
MMIRESADDDFPVILTNINAARARFGRDELGVSQSVSQNLSDPLSETRIKSLSTVTLQYAT